jgi:hypothetical protein
MAKKDVVAEPISRQRRWQAKMVAEGRCSRCGGPLAEESISQCEKCMKKQRKRYEKRK